MFLTEADHLHAGSLISHDLYYQEMKFLCCLLLFFFTLASAEVDQRSVDSQIEFERNFTIATLVNAATKQDTSFENITIETIFEAASDVVHSAESNNLINNNDSTVVVKPATTVTEKSEEEELIHVNPFGDFENPFYSMQTLPLNASVFELVKAQIYADFKPFLILIPEPVKKYIRSQLLSVSKSSLRVLSGALAPMSYSAFHILEKVGKIAISFGHFIVTSAQTGLVWLDSQTKQQRRMNLKSATTSSSSVVVRHDDNNDDDGSSLKKIDPDMSEKVEEEYFTSAFYDGDDEENRSVYQDTDEKIEFEEDDDENLVIEV